MEGIPIIEIAEKTGMTHAAVKQRLQQRNIKPVRYLGRVGLYREEDIDKVKEPLPRGKRSPKWGKNRKQEMEAEETQ